MKALITGASSGLGYDFAKYLSSLGHSIIIVARRKNLLEDLANQLDTNVRIIEMDLSSNANCLELYNMVKNENIDILINNAGFGEFGDFCETSLDKELNMINVNITALHILTKLFLQDMKKKNSGYILNVSSLSAFFPGPLMATYYSTKTYILKLTESIYEELRKDKSKVSLSTLCPGPVKTNFNNIANVKFSLKALDSYYVAKYGIDKMFRKKLIIIPGFINKIAKFFSGFIPVKLAMKFSYKIQKRKKM